MSYQEKRSLVSIATTLLVSSIYLSYMLGRFPGADVPIVELLRYWGAVILLSIPVFILATIFVTILFVILNTIVTREGEPKITDERDKLIELKASRNGMYVFMVGIMLAMTPLLIDLPVSTMLSAMFLTLYGMGMLSSVVSDVSQFLYYRRGV
ncbi:MAG: DUF2178 domain-containing protein [Anaerolineae bacterium]|nr:DUF2178 domain-containing protein [Anaerolineae bacterium]